MATVTFDGQSFSINGRRTWLLGASVHYARIEPDRWEERLGEVRRAGFNLVETACPWFLHEPREGRFEFDGEADIVRFVRLCGEHGLRVLLRPGPSIGGGYDGGGLPAWLTDRTDVRLRESDDGFLRLVNRYFRELLTRLVELQATHESGSGGPLLLVQCEHAWHCANDAQGAAYLQELTRFIRECGINLPVLTANDFWQDVDGAIETWSGSESLLANLRQLRAIQSHAPRIVSTLESAAITSWGDDAPSACSSESVLYHLGQVLASGAQPIVMPVAGGTSFGFSAGRRPGGPASFATTAAALDPPIGPGGTITPKLRLMRRLISFAGSFAHVFADLDPSVQPVTMDPGTLGEAAAIRAAGPRRPATGPAIVSLRGGQGRVVFVFAGAHGPRETTLLLDTGVRMPIHLGDQPVGWYAFDVDLQGRGRLDYCNACPFAIVDRSILVLQGPARHDTYLSINGSPLQLRVPGGSKPEVVEHQGMTIVLCNQRQIDATIPDDDTVFVGADRIDDEGRPIPAEGFAKAWAIRAGGNRTSISGSGTGRTPPAIRPKSWRAAPCAELVDGSSPRFATLDGPQTLVECRAQTGYGWYRLRFASKSSRKRLLHLPAGGDRLHLYLDGKLHDVVGVGAGATEPPFELSLPTGDVTLVALTDNLGRFDGGNDRHDRKGLYGHLYEVKPLRSYKGKAGTGDPVDPFTLRGFIDGHCEGQLSDTRRATWTIVHRRKAPLLFEVVGVAASAIVMLNGEPFAFYAGATGATRMRLLLEPGVTPGFKRGTNAIAVIPTSDDGAIEAFVAHSTLYECVDTLTANADWGFSRWEPPADAIFEATTAAKAKSYRRRPCWWSGSFAVKSTALPLSVDVSGLSKGQVFVNGRNLGRYFTSTATGRRIGPQTRLHLPASWVRTDAENTLTIFDEHGFSPFEARVIRG